ncbi:MAG: disulfide oxidoreductase, partial [Pseudomonadota bacterium]
ALSKGMQEFPESPPPGLVTIPVPPDPVSGADAMSGYRIAGARAIRIDMLERLADLLRAEDSRGGFEASPDMLSITGMTLDQFADLMQGLGYVADKGEREKVKAASDEEAAPAPAEEAQQGADEVAPEESVQTTEPAAADPEPSKDDEGPTVETYYTFTWGGHARRKAEQRPRGKPQGKAGGKPGRGKAGKGKPKGQPKAKSFEARPPRKEKPIDPDSPFAALAALKGKT